MNKIKHVVLALLLFSIVGTVLAQTPPAMVVFKDGSNGTRTLLSQEFGATYPNGVHAGRYCAQWYKTTDDTIDGIDPVTKEPLNDDVKLNNDNNLQIVTTSNPIGAWTATGISFPETATETNGLMGAKVYIRIFNAPTVAAATKYLVLNGFYTVTTVNPQVADIRNAPMNPLNGWSAWTPIVDEEDFELDITANYPGAAILYSADGVDGTYAPTGQTADHTFAAGDALAGWYKMGDLAGVTWVTPAFNFENTEDATVRFLGTKTPGYATNPVPADGTIFEWAWNAPATADIPLVWDPVAGVNGYMVYWNGAVDGVDVTEGTTYVALGLVEGPYTWKVVPYINDPAKGRTNLAPVKAKITDRSINSPKGSADPAMAPVWGFEIVRLPKPPIEIGTGSEPPPGVTVVDGGIIPEELLGPDTGIPAIINTVTATGIWNVRVNNPGWGVDWYCWIKIGGNLLAGPNPIPASPAAEPFYIFNQVNFGDAKGDAQVIINDNATLPVELSSFNAVLTAQYFVKLTWISQSETNLNGYRVYRSEGNELVSATMITPIIISATNTSSTQVYSIEDREVAFGNTYWYWLESVENDGSSNFHGPTSVFVEGEVPPVLPQTTTMRSAYPNPFKAASTTTIEVAVKEGESGTLTIYNVLGQVVKTYSLNQGNHNLKWNGKDSKGNLCSSGIYFYKLSSPTMNQTKKMVIVK